MSKNGVRNWLGAFVVVLLLNSLSVGQNMILQPATVEDSDGNYNTKLLLKRDSEFRLNWTRLDGSNLNLNGTGSSLVIGRIPNTYDVVSVNVTGRFEDLIPDDINLSPGRYYARITNSTKTTTTEIQDDFEQNGSSILYSNEILLLVEANEAPSIIAPRGNIDNPSPTFQWTAVSGVPSYWLIVSSTPFDITEDENGDIAIEGATIVWQYVSPNTTADYGAINPLSPFTEEAPPLNSGQEYSYTVLNVYEDNNPTFTSTVFGGIVPFTYIDPDALPVTNLLSPANDVTFFAEPIITFEWEEVSSAVNYTISVLQIVKQQGIDVTIPIWSIITSNTLVEYPAIENLKNGEYQWNIITNNSTGGGSTSESRFFNYEVETGEFAASLQSSSDNSQILGAELTAKAISDGVTPVLPFFVQSETHYDSLVTGTYEFVATKEGFENGVGEFEINNGKTTRFTLEMAPLPSSISGKVANQDNEDIDNARVVINNIASNFSDETVSDGNGNFNFSLNEGTYQIEVSKTGFISAEEQTISVGLNEQLSITETFVLTNDEASISGFVYNDQGEPIQRAKVTITDEVNSYETNTNGSGLFQFIISSGTWTLSAEKIGFVKGENQTVSLSTGDVAQNQNFILTGNANQVTGFVRERITNEDGSVGTTIFDDVEVKAIPNVGEAISTRTSRNGQYSLSLRSGSYTIEAIEENYTSNEERELVIGIAVGETISGMDFELIPNPSSISGTVTLPDGNGVQEAVVTVENVGTVTTSGSGFYEISVPEGAQTVSVFKNGLVSPDAKNVAVSIGQDLTGVDFEMTPNAGTVSGIITSGGESISNTRITAVNTATSATAELTNNLNGTYSFNLNSGTWYLRADKSGFLSDSTDALVIGPGQQLVNQNLSLLENLTSVRGTITDGIDALRNADVTVTRLDGSEFEQSTVTQINGTYAFSLPAGKAYLIRATKDGFKSSSSETDNLIPGETVNQDFELSANPGSIAGKITVDGDRVLKNANVTATNSNGLAIDSTRTSADGRYLLGLEPDTYTITAKKAGYTPSTSNSTIEIGQNITGINLSIEENFALISGQITDTDGIGIEQVFVNIQKNGAVGASTVTDQDGNFNISGLTRGDFTIDLTKNGFISTSETVQLNDGDFLTYNRELTSKDGSISGVISDENGIAIEDATVTATNSDGTNYTSITNELGAYTIGAVEPSNYSVNASKTGYTTSQGTLAEVTIDDINVSNINVSNLIPNNGVIQGTITNRFTGDPIKNVQVSAVGTRGSGFVITGANGSFELVNLIPADYTIISTKNGFKSDTVSVTIEPTNPTLVVSRDLLQNNGSIIGKITDDNGDNLSFRVTVKASNNSETLTTQTNDTGDFTFEGIETGVTYKIETDIYREGYKNTSTSIDVPVGVDEISLDKPLEVVINQGIISGNAGIGSATIKLLNASTNQIIELTSSNVSGNYRFKFLEAGSYKITVNRLGYIFSPNTSSTINLSSTETAVQDFNAQANIGTLTVSTVTGNAQPKSNVNVSIISIDTTVILSGKSSKKGITVFKDIKAGTEYTVRASFDRFNSNPAVRTVSLSSGDSISTSFELSANSSSISGLVKLNSDGTLKNLSGANVKAILNSTGQSFELSTNKTGSYSFSDLAVGTYSIIAAASGFTQDTVLVNLTAGSDLTADDLILEKASVDILGYVFYKGKGVESINVEAISKTTRTTITDSNGRYRFLSLPIKTGDTDTTTFKIKITSGLFVKTYVVTLTANDVGKRKTLPITNLPSGQINLTITDGVSPLGGAILEFGLSGGESNSIVTGSDGTFNSDENLRKATYVVSVAKKGFLIPQNTIRIVLLSDTTILSSQITIPYRQVTVKEILADERTPISVVNPSGYNNDGAFGSLFYKTASQNQFASVEMTKNGDSLTAVIPALNSTEEVAFYTTIKDTLANNTFVSRQTSLVPLASGILTNVRVSPTVNGQLLRVGEIYNLELFVRDGVNKSLEEAFLGVDAIGTVNWINLSDTTGLDLKNQEGTNIQIIPTKPGTYSINVSAILDGSSVSSTITFVANEVPLESIVVSSPGRQLQNSASHVFSYSAVDTSGNSVLLGESLNWEVKPSTFGNIDKRGQFTPKNSNLLGLFSVSVTDSVSGLSGNSEQIELVARIRPDEAYTLINGEGLELELPSGSVDIPSQVSLIETRPAPSKKFVFGQGTDQSYTVGDRIYVLSLSGSELKSIARLTIPTDTTFSALNTGVREIGRFNFTTLQWEIFGTIASKSFNQSIAGTVATEKLGQFAVLSTNQSLGLSNAAVLPSPFSPDIAPVKIGYWLDTAFPPAKVTIKIYNVRGELVRTLLEDELQQPGRYGSRSSSLEISWDGRTEAGLMARNGRYIVQITAADQQSEEVKLLQVILIK